MKRMNEASQRIIAMVSAGVTQDIVIPQYAAMIRENLAHFDNKSISAADDAIVKRWSSSGLSHIKAKAWKIVNDD